MNGVEDVTSESEGDEFGDFVVSGGGASVGVRENVEPQNGVHVHEQPKPPESMNHEKESHSVANETNGLSGEQHAAGSTEPASGVSDEIGPPSTSKPPLQVDTEKSVALDSPVSSENFDPVLEDLPEVSVDASAEQDDTCCASKSEQNVSANPERFRECEPETARPVERGEHVTEFNGETVAVEVKVNGVLSEPRSSPSEELVLNGDDRPGELAQVTISRAGSSSRDEGLDNIPIPQQERLDKGGGNPDHESSELPLNPELGGFEVDVPEDDDGFGDFDQVYSSPTQENVTEEANSREVDEFGDFETPIALEDAEKETHLVLTSHQATSDNRDEDHRNEENNEEEEEDFGDCDEAQASASEPAFPASDDEFGDFDEAPEYKEDQSSELESSSKEMNKGHQVVLMLNRAFSEFFPVEGASFGSSEVGKVEALAQTQRGSMSVIMEEIREGLPVEASQGKVDTQNLANLIPSIEGDRETPAIVISDKSMEPFYPLRFPYGGLCSNRVIIESTDSNGTASPTQVLESGDLTIAPVSPSRSPKRPPVSDSMSGSPSKEAPMLPSLQEVRDFETSNSRNFMKKIPQLGFMLSSKLSLPR